MQAWKAVSRNQIEGILDTIRNRLLNFLLELEELIPETNEQIQKDFQIPNERVTQIFNNNIYGDHTLIAAGYSVTQSVIQQVAKGNLNSLEEALKTMGIEAEDIQSLVDALEKDGEPTQEQGFGEQVLGWIGRMETKMVSEGWEAAKGIAPSMVIDVLTKYLGWN